MSEDLFERAERVMATSQSLWSRTIDLIADAKIGTDLKLVQFRLRTLINSGVLPSLDEAQSQDISEALQGTLFATESAHARTNPDRRERRARPERRLRSSSATRHRRR